jgi:pimeloyl-ACP methyl ester carboxylesterase
MQAKFALKRKPSLFYLDPYPNNQRIILLIHGLGSDSSSWQLQFPALNALGYRPIAIDLPGFGRSPYPLKIWRIRRVTNWIAQEIMDSFSEPIEVMGLSLGGVIAQKLAQVRPQKVKRLILVSTFSRLHPRLRKNFPYLRSRIIQIFSGRLKEQAQNVADHIFPQPDQKLWHDYLYNQICHANIRVYRQAMLELAKFSSFRFLRTLKIPVLVITGSADNTVSLEDQALLARRIPGSTHIFIQGGRHAVNVDHAQEFNAAISKFLSQKI